MTITAVVLAAGESSRLGRPKQDVVLNGETLLERTVRVAQEAGLRAVIVVVREARYIDSLQGRGAVVLLNRAAFEGMASSLRCGIEAAQAMGVDGAVVLTCDQPAVTAAHLRDLIAAPSEVRGSFYAERKGVPAYFPKSSFGELMKMEGDVGARSLLIDAETVALEELSVDVDTEDGVRAAKMMFGG